MKKEIHNGQTCIFTEPNHIYKVDDKILTSVTTFKSRYFPKFDTQRIARQYAKKNGYTVKDVLTVWKRKGEIGRNKGTALHSYVENLLLKKPPPILPEELNGYESVLSNMVHELLQSFEVVGVEKIVFSTYLGLAGQVDSILRKGHIVLLIDWKTDKQIHHSNDWGQTALPPISHLADCNFNQYAIQLNLYETILRTEYYFPDDTVFFKRVIHLSENKVVRYRIPTLTDEIDQLLS